jgi:hypothetical protein
VESHGQTGDARPLGFDASLRFEPGWPGAPRIIRTKWWHRHKLGTGERVYRDDLVYRYEPLVNRALAEPPVPYPRIPCVCPGWDNSVRRKEGAIIFTGSTPEIYERWLRETVTRLTADIDREEEEDGQISCESLLFINAWNEWGEGNHLEPCQRWGRAYLEATRRALGI